MTEHLCPKCGGKLVYDAADRLFVCEACGNRYYREVILGASPRNDDLRVYCAPQASGGGEVELSSQYAEESPAEMPPPPPAGASERVGANTLPKPTKVTRRTQRYMARYDREREKRERDRLEAEAESRLWEETLSEGMRRANQKAVGTPTATAAGSPAPAPLSRVAVPIGGATPATYEAPEVQGTEEVPPTRARLELSLEDARLTLRDRQQTLKRLSSDIWRMERAPGQSRRDFKNALAEANREIDRAELAVKEAKIAVKEAKRRLKKAK